MRKIFTTAVLAVMLFQGFGAGGAWGVSDDEYRELMRTSPELRDADARLNAVWKTVNGKLPNLEHQRLIADQRLWLEVVRDILVDRMIQNGTPVRLAFAAVTRVQADMVEEYLAGGWRANYNVKGVLRAGDGRFSKYKLEVPSRTGRGTIFIHVRASAENDTYFDDAGARVGEECTVVGTLNIGFDSVMHISGINPASAASFPGGIRKAVDDNTTSAGTTVTAGQEPISREERLQNTLEHLKKMSDDLSS